MLAPSSNFSRPHYHSRGDGRGAVDTAGLIVRWRRVARARTRMTCRTRKTMTMKRWRRSAAATVPDNEVVEEPAGALAGSSVRLGGRAAPTRRQQQQRSSAVRKREWSDTKVWGYDTKNRRPHQPPNQRMAEFRVILYYKPNHNLSILVVSPHTRKAILQIEYTRKATFAF